MNAPATLTRCCPTSSRARCPPPCIDALKARFGERCTTALAVREQHGRDESPFHVPPPDAVVFCREHATTWPPRCSWPTNTRCR